jgi:hypothetical protein
MFHLTKCKNALFIVQKLKIREADIAHGAQACVSIYFSNKDGVSFSSTFRVNSGKQTQSNDEKKSKENFSPATSANKSDHKLPLLYQQRILRICLQTHKVSNIVLVLLY